MDSDCVVVAKTTRNWTPIIIGVVFAGIATMALVVVILVCFRRKSQQSRLVIKGLPNQIIGHVQNFACQQRRTIQMNSQSFESINHVEVKIFTSKSV